MAATMMDTGKGTFSAGTVKRNTLNMYDTHATRFAADPLGPYESPQVEDQATAQEHFNATREIKLREHLGAPLPVTSYRDHYPPKEALAPGEPLELGTGGMPFTSRTEYADQYFQKPRGHRPIGLPDPAYTRGPMLVKETTNLHFYKPFEFPPGEGTTQRLGREAAPPPQAPSTWDTTYRVQYVPKEGPARVPGAKPDPKDPLPWLVGPTTYGEHYVPKPLLLLAPAAGDPGDKFPFRGITEYKDQYIPKEALPQVPPLTGLVSKEGIQLPLPRRSLGVEIWHKGTSDHYYVLIPRHMDVPCRARQIFTTRHDNQEQACILVLYGDDPIASNNQLLGQFDLVNIPPAPKEVPRIEVTFVLDRTLMLTAEARDLDTLRHKLWVQRGEVIVLKQ